MERVFVYIDGQNFYNKIFRAYQFHYLSFGIRNLCDYLVGEKREIMGIRYYCGQVKQTQEDLRSKAVYDAQQRTLQKLKSDNIYTVLGRIQKIGDQYREKGVDVRLAIDLIEGAYEDRFDTALVISSDSDLVPAFEMLKRKGKKVEVTMFDRNYSMALSRNASTFRILNKSDLLPFGRERNDV